MKPLAATRGPVQRRLAGHDSGVARGVNLRLGTSCPYRVQDSPFVSDLAVVLDEGEASSPAPGTPGEGWGGGGVREDDTARNSRSSPLPALPRSTGGGNEYIPPKWSRTPYLKCTIFWASRFLAHPVQLAEKTAAKPAR